MYDVVEGEEDAERDVQGVPPRARRGRAVGAPHVEHDKGDGRGEVHELRKEAHAHERALRRAAAKYGAEECRDEVPRILLGERGVQEEEEKGREREKERGGGERERESLREVEHVHGAQGCHAISFRASCARAGTRRMLTRPPFVSAAEHNVTVALLRPTGESA